MQIMNFVEATDRGEQNAQESYVFCGEDSTDGTRRAFNPEFLLE